MDARPTSPDLSAATHDCRCGEACYRIRLPDWGSWLRLLDESGAIDAQGSADIDIERLLRSWLRRSLSLVKDDQERPLGGAALDALPSGHADHCLATSLDLLDAQRAGLDLRPCDEGLLVADRLLRLSAWSFAERNAVLRRHLRLDHGSLALDCAGFELSEVAHCAAWADDDTPLTVAMVAAWPVPLGETVADLLARANDPAPAEGAILQASINEGYDHPDLICAELCRGYGWTPDQVAALSAQDAQRHLMALRLLGPAAGPATSAPATTPVDDGFTRIVVTDG